MKLIVLLERKYNGRLFKNNPSKDREASEIVRNSRIESKRMFERRSMN